jgi:hypothetical protein
MSEIGDDKDIYDVYEQEKEMAHSHAWDMTLAQAQDAPSLSLAHRHHRYLYHHQFHSWPFSYLFCNYIYYSYLIGNVQVQQNLCRFFWTASHFFH